MHEDAELTSVLAKALVPNETSGYQYHLSAVGCRERSPTRLNPLVVIII
jgi:hypothetical protein